MHHLMRTFLAASCLFAQQVSAEPSERIEILHYWSAEAEQRALGVFRQEAIDTGITWHEIPVVGTRDALQVEFSGLLSIGTPPSVVQWVIDGQLPQLIDAGVFSTIPDEGQNFKDLYVPEVYKLIQYGDGIQSAPVGIHSYNFLVYNRALLEKYGLEPVSDLSDLIGYGELLAKDGIPLVSQSHQGWQLRYPMLSAISVEMTAEEYTDLLTKGKNVSHLQEKLTRVFDFFVAMMAFNEDGTKDQSWTESVAKVDRGEALVLMMGDFAIPQFSDQGNIVCQPAPKSSDIYVGIDSFAFPAVEDPALVAGQKRFLQISTDPKLVARYVNLKGGLPPIFGVDAEDLTPCNAINMKKWERAGKVWARSEETFSRYAAFAHFLSLKAGQDGLSGAVLARELIGLFNRFY